MCSLTNKQFFRHNIVELFCLCLFKIPSLAFSKEVIGCWRLLYIFLSQLHGEIVDHIFDICSHVDLYFAMLREIHFHSNKVMHLAPHGLNLPIAAIFFVDPALKLIVDFGLSMAAHQIINMEPDGVLSSIFFAIHNAWVIWVELESNFFQISMELLVKKQAHL